MSEDDSLSTFFSTIAVEQSDLEDTPSSVWVLVLLLLLLLPAPPPPKQSKNDLGLEDTPSAVWF
jgi:hypothetical protein